MWKNKVIIGNKGTMLMRRNEKKSANIVVHGTNGGSALCMARNAVDAKDESFTASLQEYAKA